jgi:hypothetical protein
VMARARRVAPAIPMAWLLSILAVADWASAHGALAVAKPRPAGLNELQVAVSLRLASEGSGVDAVCPTLQGAEVSDEVGKTLALLHLEVREYTDCVLRRGNYVEKGSGQRATVLRIDSIAFKGPRDAVVEARYLRGILLPQAYRFSLRYSADWWQFVSEERR